MSAYVLLNLLNELGKRNKCEACRAFYPIFATSLINSIYRSTNVRYYLSYDIIFTLKSHFWHNNNCVIMYVTFYMEVITFPVYI